MKKALVCIFFGLAATYCSAAIAPIFRPCHFQNHQCIGEVLAANSYCNDSGVPRSIPEPQLVPTFRFEAPHFNSSYLETDLKISNLGQCLISEFFVNSETDNVVLGLDCYNLGFESDRTMYQHKPLQEDDIYYYHFNGVYPFVRFTIQMKNSPSMDLCTNATYVHAHVAALPIFKVDPKDKPTSSYLSTDMSTLYIFERETFHYRGPSIARYYINNMICAFGCF